MSRWRWWHWRCMWGWRSNWWMNTQRIIHPFKEGIFLLLAHSANQKSMIVINFFSGLAAFDHDVHRFAIIANRLFGVIRFVHTGFGAGLRRCIQRKG